MVELSFGAKFGRLIKDNRDARGWSLANLALEVFGDDGTLGESRKGDVHKLETGQTAKPRASTIKRYCDALEISQADVDALRSPDQMPTVTQMRRLLAERDHLKAGQTLTELQVIGLAERVAENIPDFDAALRELDQALTVAEDLKARSQQTSNHADFVDEVFKEVQRLNDEDNPDEAAATLQRAFDEGAAQQARLLDGLIEQHSLRQDVDATVQALLTKLRMDVPDPSQHFIALRALGEEYRQQGLTHGTRFDSLVAIALTETCKTLATSDDQTGIALNDLGNALRNLGEREDSPDRLNAAVKAHNAALEVYTKDAMPRDWAMTQNNLGNALQTLGTREDSPDRLNAAIKAYNAALEVYTKDDLPRNWATTQNNLGGVLEELGTREDSPDRLNAAVNAYEAALEVRTKDALPMDWAMTQNNLGTVLEELGTRGDSPDHLNAAVKAYNAALEVRTQDALPMDWAFTQFNMCGLHLALFDQTADTAHLDRAQTHLDNAVEVFTRAEASQYLKMAANLQTDITARRDTL